jgi:hypothetical protein
MTILFSLRREREREELAVFSLSLSPLSLYLRGRRSTKSITE